MRDEGRRRRRRRRTLTFCDSRDLGSHGAGDVDDEDKVKFLDGGGVAGAVVAVGGATLGVDTSGGKQEGEGGDQEDQHHVGEPHIEEEEEEEEEEETKSTKRE